MRRLYGVRFAIDRPERRVGVVMSDTTAQMWGWAFAGSPPPGGWRDGRRWGGDREIETEQVRREGSDLRRLEVTEPHPGDRSGKWRWTVDLVRDGARVEFGVALDVVDQIIVDLDPPVESPEIVATVADGGGAFAGPVPLRSQPVEVRGEEQTGWLTTLLGNATRTLPIVVFTARPAAQTAQYAVSDEVIERFARSCVGVARVVLVPDPADTFRITDTLGSDLRVFNGAMRLYRPNLAQGKHPLFMPDRINGFVLNGLVNQFVSDAASRYHLSESAMALLAERQRTSEREDVRVRLGAVTDLRDQVVQYGREVDRLLAEVARLTTEVSAREATIADQARRIDEIESEVTRIGLETSRTMRHYEVGRARSAGRREMAGEVIDVLTAAMAQWQAESDTPEPTIPAEIADLEPVKLRPAPESIEEAVIRAQDEFEGTVHITDVAAVAAGRLNSRHVPATKVWAALEALDRVARMWQSDELPVTGREGALKELGFPVAHVSDTAYGRFRDEYEFTHDNVRVRVDGHVRIGDSERIYWYEDGLSRKFIVNHIGAHLRDSTAG